MFLDIRKVLQQYEKVHFKFFLRRSLIYQTFKMLTLEGNIKLNNRFNMIVFGLFLGFALHFHLGKFACLVKANFYTIQF